jgi:hypothetical protein
MRIYWVVRYNGIEQRFANEDEAREFHLSLMFCGVQAVFGWITDK